MNESEQHYTLNELAGLVDLPRRTVRYYIQIGLIDRPLGVGRGAHYARGHLEQLLALRKWQNAGLSLERIRELLSSPEDGVPLPPPRTVQPGMVAVKSHLLVADGLELVIDSTVCALTPEQLRQFSSDMAAALKTLTTLKDDHDE